MFGQIQRRAAVLALLLAMSAAANGAELPAEIAASGESVVLQVHALGASAGLDPRQGDHAVAGCNLMCAGRQPPEGRH